jgi:hypothetical protein
MSKQILVFGHKTFKVTVPYGASITFGPWSPPSEAARYAPGEKAMSGTLRIYEGAKSTTNILAVFSGVRGFRDLSLGYAEEVAREEGAVIWNDDEKGYQRETKTSRSKKWIVPQLGGGEDEESNDEVAF